jgi:hypothetical protein
MVIPGALIGRQGETPLRLLGAEFSSRLALARASNAMLRDASGILQTAAPNVLRFDGPARRALLEGQRTNAIRNPRAEGAAAGVLPTYWARQGSVNIVNVAGAGIEFGLPYIDIRIAGTGTGSNTALAFESSNSIAVVENEIWSASVYAALIAGSMTGITNFSISLLGVSGTFTPSAAMVTPTPAMTRYSITGTAGAGTTFLVPRMLFAVAASTTVDATIRLWLPQAEKGAFPTSPIPPPVGTLAAATRAADLLTAPVAAIFPGGAGTVLLAGLLPQAAVSADQTLLQIDDGTAGNALLLRNAAGTGGFLAGRVLAGAIANAAASAGVTPGTPFALGLAFDGSGLSLLLRGDAEKVLATTVPAGLTTLRVGGGIGGANALFGEVGEFRVLPYRASAAEMALLLASF